jgi:hypothetical protein
LLLLLLLQRGIRVEVQAYLKSSSRLMSILEGNEPVKGVRVLELSQFKDSLSNLVISGDRIKVPNGKPNLLNSLVDS